MATTKQIKAVNEIITNHSSVKEAMKKAGYAKGSIANTTTNLTKTKGFRELMEQIGISDEKLAQRLNEGLDATKAVVMGVKSEESFVDIQPDYVTRHKYIETSLKLKGHTIDKPSTNVYQLIQEQKNHYGI